jgi:hypothetical protein
MESTPKPNPVDPPKLIPSFLHGFDTVANHIGLIILPLTLDLLLWFGPHVKIKNLLQPFIGQMASLPGFDTPDMAEIVRANQTLWQFFAEHYNLASTLRSYPIGVPSLISSEFTINTPLGIAPVIEVKSAMTAFGIWMLFFLVGLIVGSLYFNWISAIVFQDFKSVNLGQTAQAILQVFLFTLICIFAILIISIPLMIIIPLLYLISPGIAEFALFLILLVLAWLLVPFLFSPHGIFAYRQNAFIAMLTSVKLVRITLPVTGLFILIALLLSQGMNILWQIPSEDSWMTLVGIVGHSFITTGIITASFVYYRDGIRWAQEVLQRNLVGQKTARVD